MKTEAQAGGSQDEHVTKVYNTLKKYSVG